MTLVPLLLLAFTSEIVSKPTDDGKCNSFDSNFKMENVIGSPWWLKAVVPLVPLNGHENLPCVGVNFTEAEYEGVKFLAGNSLNHVFDDEENLNFTALSKIIIRQRYFVDGKTYDIWSIMLEAQGCFMQVLTMNSTHRTDFQIFREPDERMQLHTLDVETEGKIRENRHLLVQLLWGNHIGAVIYSDFHDVTDLHLRKAYEFVTKLRGPQLMLQKCDGKKKSVR